MCCLLVQVNVDWNSLTEQFVHMHDLCELMVGPVCSLYAWPTTINVPAMRVPAWPPRGLEAEHAPQCTAIGVQTPNACESQ